MPDYKNDLQSISPALLEVDQSVLNKAQGNLVPQSFSDTLDYDAFRNPALASAVLQNVTTKVFLRGC